MSDYETPLFKILPKNDTGKRSSHQGGFVLPKDLRPYFPELAGASTESPAPDFPMEAVLVDGTTRLGVFPTRYQLQTWGGTRLGETRITGNVDRLLDTADAEDILLIERKVDEDSAVRITLIRKSSGSYASIIALTSGRRWGVLGSLPAPTTEAEVQQAEGSLVTQLSLPFEMFETTTTVVQQTKRIARSRAFVRFVMKAYQRTCSICGGGLVPHDGATEVQAAHIVGKADSGSDDVRNGLALCRSDHWAFDNGVCSIDQELRLSVRQEALALPRNSRLEALHGKPILLPSNTSWRPHIDAIKWHYARFIAH